MKHLHRPSPAMIVALTALVVAMAGTGYAATHLPRDSVKSKQIKDGQVKTVDLANAAVTNAKLAPDSVTGANVVANTLSDSDVQPNALTGASIDEASLAETSGPPSGPAGGDLAGTFPNPTIANEAYGEIGNLGSLSGGHGITQAQVSHPATGVYCFDTTPNPGGMFVTPFPSSAGASFTVHPASGACPNFESVVESFNSSLQPINASFYILLK